MKSMGSCRYQLRFRYQNRYRVVISIGYNYRYSGYTVSTDTSAVTMSEKEGLLAGPSKAGPVGDNEASPPYHQQPQVVYQQPPANTVRHILTSPCLSHTHTHFRKEQRVIR